MDGLARRYLEVRRQTDRLAEPLSAEDCQVQSMPDASPTKWHLAHTSWFFETFVLPGLPLEPSFQYLFNSYYEAVGPRHPRPARGLLTRPSLDDVRRYRRRIDEAVLDRIERRMEADVRARLVLGLHHEQQHQELILTDIKHVLGAHPDGPPYRRGSAPAPRPAAPPLEWIARPGGITEIGVAEPGADGEPFAFDNESPRHQVLLRPYALASRPVTCGGYRRPELWLSDGWAEITAQRHDRPLYWRGQTIFTLDGERQLIDDEPVTNVSFYEADAFARWAGARLPTEFEWESVAVRELGAASPSTTLRGNFVEDGLWHPAAAAVSGTERAGAVSQLFGDVWEWTASAYAPYPRFRPMNGALGEYNGKFMVNQLVLRGGSCASPRSHIRATYRNFFYPTARWQFSGVRLAADAR
jgi:ergothioneine biosynthesis protein EgtB